jgi:DNA-binding NtrC family response regulator
MSQATTRRELDAIGRRRKKLRKLEEELARDTKKAISHARRDNVPMTEAADRVGLERTTIYQVYDTPQATSQPSSNGRGSARPSQPASVAA